MTAKILIADDEQDLELLIRQRFRKHIRDKLYEFEFAHNGVEAIEKLQADPGISLVLSDINMPVMDGLQLLSRMKDLQLTIPPVIVSAYGDMTNIRTAMNRGAFDFLTKPIDFQDFEATVVKTLAHYQAMQQAARARSELTALQRELDVASQIQQSILPRVFPPCPGMLGLELHAVMIAARNVGGDFFDFFRLGDGKVAVVIGDVSGKGMPAAIFMAMSRTLLKAVAYHCEAPGKCLSEVNRLLCDDNNYAEMFVTLFYGILDLKTGDFTYSNGGHNPPYVLRSDGPQALELTGDMMLGMIEGQEYHDKAICLAPGDGLFLYTDGVTEAMDPADKQFTDDRLEGYLRGAVTADVATLVKGVVDAVRHFAAGAPQSDDITALALRYRP